MGPQFDLPRVLQHVADTDVRWLLDLARESGRDMDEALAEAIRKGISRLRSEERYAKRVAGRRKVSPPPQ